jgi:capsular exopolysaccharide synthesis family protein
MQTDPNKNKLNIAPNTDIKKYLLLIKRKKWVIISIFTVMFVVSSSLLFNFGPKTKYKTTALLEFSDTRDLAGMDSQGRPEYEGELGILMSRSFLGTVVDKLGLAFSLKDFSRNNIVDSVQVSADYQLGNYTLKREEDNVKLYFSSPDGLITDKLVLDKKFPKDFNVSYGGCDIALNKLYWDSDKSVEFTLNKRDETIEDLRKELRPLFTNRQNTILYITYTGTDRHLIAQTLNTLVEEFVKRNIHNKKKHIREVVQILTEQLKQAKQTFDAAQDELKNFREKNPFVTLSANPEAIIGDRTNLESDKITLQNKKSDLELVLRRHNEAEKEEKYAILNEILSFLTTEGVSTVAALSSEFAVLNTERNNLLASFNPDHPVIHENTAKLDALEGKVLLTAHNQIKSYDSRISSLNSKIRDQQRKLTGLPAKEMEFAELQSTRNVADEVYSSLLVRYNKAKVADAVEVGSVNILDYAIVPEQELLILLYLRYAGLAILVGLVSSFGFVLVVGFFDKTVRTSDELMKIMPIKVVAKIPIIGSEKESFDASFDGTKRIDPKLVTADYSPTAMGEEYRALRTQILFARSQQNIRSLFITSLNPDEGKSLNTSNIAITFAQQKIPTLLIDADLRRGVLHNSFACKKKPGLSDFLYSNADINDENIQKVIQQTHIPNLYLMTSGIPVPNPSEILGSQRAKEIFKFLSDRFGFVIVDSPPINITTDAVVISRYVDSGIFVVRAGKTNVEDVKSKVSQYDNFQEHLFGFILNCVETETYKNSYKYSYYNY